VLEKAKVIKGITIKRRGCGYFLILLQVLKDYGELNALNKYLTEKNAQLPVVCREVLMMAVRQFTNIKNPKRWVKKNMGLAIEILVEIVKYNSIPEKQGETGKDNGIDELAVDILEIVSRGGYASNPEYVFDKIDLPTVYQLKKRLEKRDRDRAWMDLKIQHDPKGAIDTLNKMVNITYTTWEDLKRSKGKKNG
jgi:hypothetical protein